MIPGGAGTGGSVGTTLGACVLVAALGIGTLSWVSDGFTAFTTERARSLRVAEERPRLPNLQLTDHHGRRLDLHRTLSEGNAIWIVGFMYARCRTLCSAMTAQFRQLQQAIQEVGWQGRVRLMLVSFDPAHDTPDVLREHARRFGIEGPDHLLAVPDNLMHLQPLLDRAGIELLALPDGEYEHNAAFHVVTDDARLSAVLPLSEPARVLLVATDLARPGAQP